MIEFISYNKNLIDGHTFLINAYLIGADGNPMRSSITHDGQSIVCQKRDNGAAALAMQQYVSETIGKMTLQTCLLPERDEPYLLVLEQARHRLMIMFNKLEEWAMFDFEDSHPVTQRLNAARSLFIDALCLQKDDPKESENKALKCLEVAIDGTEELALAHSDLLLTKRRSTNSFSPLSVGCGINLKLNSGRLGRSLLSNFDFVQIPTPWRQIEPKQGNYQWQALDNWVDWASRNKLPIVAGPILTFDALNIPDWLYIWEHDYDTVRELAYEHVHRIAGRYKGYIAGWKAVSGLHENGYFTFNFDQIMDLSRMAVIQLQRTNPKSKVIIELKQPFGEYYSTNARSIPPKTYSELLVNSSLHFDMLGVELFMGQARPGQYVRDLMQVSSLLDQLVSLGKPIMLTGGAPSKPVTKDMLFSKSGEEIINDDAGYWRRPWTPLVQGRWMEALMQIALSKPRVESTAWTSFIDHNDLSLPLSGLVNEKFQPKKSFNAIVRFRKLLKTKPDTNVDDNGKSDSRIADAIAVDY